MESLTLSDRSIYEALPHERCTRVLRMLESTPDEHEKLVIEMTMLDMDTITGKDENEDDNSLTNDEGYDALSYTWGPPLFTPESEREYSSANDISVLVKYHSRSSFMLIGKNLYEALLHLWTTGRRRTLWVDALCINQKDLVEKGKHILLMGDIYSKADMVLVWFGRDDPDSPTFEHILWLHSTVLDQLRRYDEEQGPRTRENIGFDKDGEAGVIYVFWPDVRVDIPARALQALYRFYGRRRYLSRAWVVQEIALSRDAVALIGEIGVPFERLGGLVSLLQTNDLGGLAGSFAESIPGGNSGVGRELNSLVLAANQRNEYTLDGDLRRCLAEWYGAHNELTTFLAAMEFNITVQSYRVTSDPRDLIYALLGMVRYSVPLDDIPVRVDYTKSFEQIYLDFTAQLLLNMPYRTILSLVHGHDKHNSSYLTPNQRIAARLPSWVPHFNHMETDFTTIFNMQNVLWDVIPEFAAGFDDPAYSSLEVFNKKLNLYARRCANIATYWKPRRQRTNSTIRDAYLNDLAWITSTLQECLSLGWDSATGESIIPAIFRVLSDDALGLQSIHERHSRLSHLLAAAVADSEVSYPNDAEVGAAVESCKQVLQKLLGQPGIPTLEEIERLKEAWAIVIQLDPTDEDNAYRIFKKLQEMWPQYDLPTDEGETNIARVIKKFWADLLKRTDIRLSPAQTVFATDNRYLGKVSGDLQQGDELWLICQAKVPFILRPTSDREYTLVGEAFVHGAMFGELITNGVAGKPEYITIV